MVPMQRRLLNFANPRMGMNIVVVICLDFGNYAVQTCDLNLPFPLQAAANLHSYVRTKTCPESFVVQH